MKCTTCGSSLVKRGTRSTRLGKKQLFLCRNCRKKITSDWPRMRFSKDVVTKAVSLYKNGFSSSEVQSALKTEGITVSRWTIIKWFRKFG